MSAAETSEESLELPVSCVRDLLNSDRKFTLIDCREEDEYHICHLKGATLVPTTRFDEAFPSGIPKDEFILIYCHHGMRSLWAAHRLLLKGYSKVHSMEGGIDEWAIHIDPSMRRY